MDPVSALGAAGSVVGIIGFGLQLSQLIVKRISDIRTAQETLHDIVHEINLITSSLSQLHELVERERDSFKRGGRLSIFSESSLVTVKFTADQCLVIFWRVEATISGDTAATFSEDELTKRLAQFNNLDLDSSAAQVAIKLELETKTLDWWARIRWTSKVSKLNKHCKQLRRYHQHLGVLLQIVTLGQHKKNPEATNEFIQLVIRTYAVMNRYASPEELNIIANNAIQQGQRLRGELDHTARPASPIQSPIPSKTVGNTRIHIYSRKPQRHDAGQAQHTLVPRTNPTPSTRMRNAPSNNPSLAGGAYNPIREKISSSNRTMARPVSPVLESRPPDHSHNEQQYNRMQIHGKHSEARSTVRSSQSVKTEHDNAKRSASIPPKEPPTREIQSQLQQVYSERISGNADCRIPHPKGHVVDYGAGQQEIRILPFMINEGVAYPLPIPLGSDFKSKLQESIRLGDPSKRLAKKLASLTVDQTQTLQTVLQPLSGSPGRKLVELAFVTKSTHKFWRKSSKVPIAFVEDRQSDMPYGISRLEAPIDMESKLLDSSIPLNTMDPVSNRNHTSQINLMTDSPEHKAENLANAAMHSNYSMPRVSGRQNIISRLQTTTPIPPNLGLLGFQNLEDFLIDEKEWLERFTEYGAWTIRPALTSDSTRTPPADWDRCVLSQEIMNISQIKLRLAVLDKAPPSVVEKLSALNLSQQLQVTRTIEEAAKAGYNTTPSRYWKLRQLDVIRARRLFKPKRVESIIVYVSKEPPAEAIRTRDRWPANTYGTRQGAMWQGNQVNDDYRGIYSTHPDGYATAPGAGQFNGDPWQPYWHPHRHPYFPLVQPPGYHSDVRRTGNAIRRPYHTAPVQYDSYSDQASRRSPSRLTDYSPTSFSRRIHSRRRRFSDESNDSYKKSSSFDSEDGSPSSDTEEWSSQDSASTSSVFRRQPEPSIHGPNQLDEDVQTRSPGKQRKHRPTEHGQPGEAIGSSADRGDESEEDTEAQAEASRQQQNNTDKTLQLRSEGHLVQRSSYFMHGRNRIGPSDHSNTRSISRNHQKLIDHTDDNDVFRGRPRERVGYPTQFDNQPYDPHAIDLEAVEKLLLEWTPHHQLESNENKAAIPQPRDQEIRAPLAKIEQGEIDGRSRQELEIIEDDRKQETMPSDSRSKPTTIPDNDGPAHHDQNLGRPAYVEDFVDDQAEAPKISKHEEQFEDAMEYIQQTSSIPLAMSKLLDGPSMPGPASGNAKDSMHLSPGASASPNPSPHFKLLGYSKDDKYEPLREESSPNIENYSRFASPLYMASPVQTPIPETSPAPTPVYETSMAPTPANIPSPAPTPKNQLPCITRGREQKGDWGPEKPKSKHPLSTANTPAEDSFSIQARLFRKGDDSKRAATFPTSIRQPWMDIEWAKQIVGDTASIAEGNEVEPELPRQRDRRPQDKKVILEGKSAHHAFRRHARRLELDDHDSAHSSPRKQGKRLTTRHGSSRQSPRRQDRKSDVKQDSARHSPRGTDRILGLERDSARSSPRRNKTLPKRHKESPRRRLTGRPSLPPQGNSQLVKHDFDHASLARRFDPPRRRQTIEFEPKAGQRHVPEHTKISEKRRRSSSPDDRATGRRHAPNRAHTWVYDKEREKELNRKIERRASHGV